tara:strand:- start:405 stop:683 length:279 start_codon:yes stop_codon:yes gene_type:complete
MNVNSFLYKPTIGTNGKIMPQIQGWNFRIDELAPQDQIIIAQLVNHLASHRNSGNYQQYAMGRLKKISQENPWQSDIEGFEKLPLNYGEEVN